MNAILCDIIHAINNFVPDLINTDGCGSGPSISTNFGLFVLIFGLLGLIGGGVF